MLEDRAKMQLNLLSNNSNQVKSIELSDEIFSKKFNESLVHQVVVSYLANARQGTHAQKSRSEVRGGGKKPWKQKGTGRARAGTIRSPLWRKGGVTFAAKNQDYSAKVNKKMYRAAMCSILSELIRQNRLHVIENIELSSPKTRELLEKLKSFKIDDALLVLDFIDENLYLASRNIFKIDIRDAMGVDPVSLISHSNVLITAAALKQFEELFV